MTTCIKNQLICQKLNMIKEKEIVQIFQDCKRDVFMLWYIKENILQVLEQI